LWQPIYNIDNFRSGVVSARIGSARPLILIVGPSGLVDGIKNTTEYWGGLDLAFMKIDRRYLVTKTASLSQLKDDLICYCQNLKDTDEYSRSVDLVILVLGAGELVGTRGIHLNKKFRLDPEIYAGILASVLEQTSKRIETKIIFAGFESMGLVKEQYSVEDGKLPKFTITQSQGVIYRRFINAVHSYLYPMLSTNTMVQSVNCTIPHPSHLGPMNQYHDESGKPTEFLQKCTSMVLRSLTNASLLNYLDNVLRNTADSTQKFRSSLDCIADDIASTHRIRHSALQLVFDTAFPQPTLSSSKNTFIIK
jgi:hypothetical protein